MHGTFFETDRFYFLCWKKTGKSIRETTTGLQYTVQSGQACQWDPLSLMGPPLPNMRPCKLGAKHTVHVQLLVLCLPGKKTTPLTTFTLQSGV